MSKFPEPVHMYIVGKRHDLDAPFDVDFIMKWIGMYIEMKEEGELYGAKCETDNCEKMESIVPSSIQSRTQAVRRVRSPTCLLCHDRHWTDGCPKFKTYDQRIKAAQGKCGICLRETHKTGDCSSMKCCVHCGGSRIHHRSLCPNLFHVMDANRITQTPCEDHESVKDIVSSQGQDQVKNIPPSVELNPCGEGPAMHAAGQMDFNSVKCAKEFSQEKYIIPQRRYNVHENEKYIKPQLRHSVYEKTTNGISCQICGMILANPIEHKIHSRVHLKSQPSWTSSLIARSA